MRTRPDTLTQITLPGGTVTVDAHGYLTDPDNWSIAFAEHVAAQEGITLTPEHHALLDFMRQSLTEHGVAPDARFAFRFLAERHALDKSASKAALFELFPYGYVKQACKIAGMKQPRAWSTG